MRHYYRCPEWKEFRADIVERDGGRCMHCGKSEDSGAVLQVHHLKYLTGRLPWDYPPRLCITLCKYCHAVEHGKVFPASGWTLVSDEDRGALDGTCDLCGTDLRYEFHIEHSKWFPLTVGTDCCDRLTESDAASIVRREKDRLIRFLSSKSWQSLPNGITIRRKKMDFQIASDTRGYFISMLKKEGKKRFPTVGEAKTAVFNLIESGEATSFVEKHKGKEL